MTFFLVASGARLTIGIGLGCLVVALRDAFKHDAQAASVPCPCPRPGPTCMAWPLPDRTRPLAWFRRHHRACEACRVH